MKALVQRVRYARITIDAKEQREIGPGMLVLFGCAEGDELSLCDKLADKVANLRIFSDEAGKMNLSALDLGLSCMVVSQFTLLADTKKGNRPSFINAKEPNSAKELYEVLLSDKKIKNGSITLVIPRKPGECELYKASFEEALELLTAGL